MCLRCKIYRAVKCQTLGSGCGSVGRAVASDSRGTGFESSHRQKFILIIYCQLLMKRRKWRKSDREWPIFIKNVKTLMRYLVAFKKFSPDEFTRKISSCPRHLYDPTFWMTVVEGIYTDPLTTTTGHLNNDFCYKSVAVLLPSNLSFCNWFHESLLSTEH